MRVLKNKVAKINPTRVVIRIRTSIAWSWKKISCSIRGAAASCRFSAFHVAMF